jgi:uncharacterized membrane protein (UPF0127 family)
MGRRGVYFFLMVLGVFQSMSACGAEPKVTISTREKGDLGFQVEVADSPAKREMGFQYRRELARDRGMIFLFPAESDQTFWMKNTPIPLDMIFISRDLKIVGIVEQATPFSLDSRSVGKPSQYVLEINGGLAKRMGIEAGDAVRFDGVSTRGIAE